jgi:hypothetical protein
VTPGFSLILKEDLITFKAIVIAYYSQQGHMAFLRGEQDGYRSH